MLIVESVVEAAEVAETSLAVYSLAWEHRRILHIVVVSAVVAVVVWSSFAAARVLLEVEDSASERSVLSRTGCRGCTWCLY